MNLNQVMVPITDLARSVAFYKTLGLKLIVCADHGYARFEADNGATFSVHAFDEVQPDRAVTIYFECAHLDTRVAALKEQGITFDTDPVDQSWLWREASLRDPDGNRLILYWAGENRLNPPWRLEG